MTTADFSKCVSDIEEIIRKEATRGVKMPTSVKIFIPDKNGHYQSSHPLAELFYEADESGIEELWLEEILKKEAGDLAGHAICAIDVGDPLIEDLEKEVRWAAEIFWKCDYIAFSCFEVTEHTSTLVRGTVRAYEYKNGKLIRYHKEHEEEMLILFPANA